MEHSKNKGLLVDCSTGLVVLGWRFEKLNDLVDGGGMAWYLFGWLVITDGYSRLYGRGSELFHYIPLVAIVLCRCLSWLLIVVRNL